MPNSDWQKSSLSSDRDDCVELAHSAHTILLRESDDPAVVMRASAPTLDALLRTTKQGLLSHTL